MGAVLLGGLRHEADIGNRSHALRIKRPVLLAEIDHRLVDAGVGAVGNDGERVPGLPLGIPHLATRTDHRRHGGVDDHIARHVKIRDPFVGVDHRNGGSVLQSRLDVGLDRGLLVGGELLDLGDEVTKAVVEINAERGDLGGMLGDQVLEEDFHRVAEDDRVGDLHHRRLHVEREEDTIGLGLSDLPLKEGDERPLAQASSVEDLAGLERGLFLEDLGGAVGSHELDLHLGRLGNGHRLLVGEEVILPHGPDAGLGIGRPRTHGVRVLAGILLHRLRGAAVGVPLAEDRVDGAPLDLVVAGADPLLRLGGRVLRIVGEFVSLRLELGDCRLELGNGGADVRELDDVRLGPEREGAEFGQSVADLLILAEKIRERRDDAAGQRDVAGLDIDPGVFGEGLDDRQERIGGQGGCLVGLGVEDGGL